ncbi:cysteine/serine-rich nuclear protein 2-like isoform X2 [Siniperca chuatsi]|uniref:cysteine/serine-rich nuclear protein 2-like isoform X2 n=1 Tax=Siniperca chuatsi TaxID=119488 RepID=UPI001CE1BEAD|nr:cysteine/serine-rich nuclear protein 2-like isoform X2 [Siniperca chuatsi]XP_044074419.1 cysteine/serine-rich nuclear protein 2-like isoform X2 [Siniperca chuatsi]XP_044074420.1 cysteine/serine-rich nuclear protein 2-like isoform X2 [Siniperca chuatsi]
MTTPATRPPLLRPLSPPLPPQSGSPTGRADPLTTTISHLTVLLHPPVYPECLLSACSSTVRSNLKRPKLADAQSNVRFDQVTVFTFPRCQGFTSVPSHGGATLGMTRRHSTLQSYTVAEHALEQRHRRRERLRERLREERLKALKHKLNTSGAIDQREADRLTVDQSPHEDRDIHISDAELEDGSFLQPYSSKQRQALLQAAGVKRIDREEKRQLHALRLSREACGCDCQGFCEPETCACSLAGIKCQVDRLNFPCGCTKDGCGNTQGRIEFNSRRVQTHYIHTAMRLELEKQLQDETLSHEDQTGLPEDLQENVDQDEAGPVQSAQDKNCPFGFAMEEDDLPLTMPATPTFHFIPERLVVEENSCSSDMTESSCSSSDSDAGGCLNGNPNLPEVDGGLSRALSICDSKNNNYSMCSQLRHTGEPLTQHSSNSATYSTSTDSMGPLTATFTDNISWTSLTDYLNENANQDFLDDDSLEGFPNTPSPTVDYSSGRYMDLSLSSDSDLVFFDCDYTSEPLHSSFKLHRHPDSFCPLQLFSSVNLPQYESSTYLLESLIGLTEPSPEQGYAVSDTQLL